MSTYGCSKHAVYVTLEVSVSVAEEHTCHRELHLPSALFGQLSASAAPGRQALCLLDTPHLDLSAPSLYQRQRTIVCMWW